MAEDKKTTQKLTLEETLERRQKEVDQIHQEHPEIVPDPNKWWLRAATFSYNIKNDLSEDANAELNRIITKIFESNFDPEIFKAALEEAKGCFAGHDELLQQFNSIFASVDNDKIDSYRRVLQSGKSCTKGTEGTEGTPQQD